MADIANVSGVRSGTQAFTQAYLSRSVRSTLASILPLMALMLALDGNKKGMDSIGIPNVGTLISRIPSARAREKQIYGAEMYQPLIHSTLPSASDGKALGMRDNMPTVGGGGGSGAILTCTISGSAVNAISVVYGGTGYSTTSGAVLVTFLGGGGTGASAVATVTNGVITGTSGLVGGTGYTAAPAVVIQSTGTSSDQHFSRPGFKWVEFADPILYYKKPMRRLKNLMAGASKADKEAAIASFLQVGTDEARVVHLTRWAKELWGITTSSDVGPSDQSAEVWDHMLSLPAACHTTNRYGLVDRSVAANAYWLGKRQTAHKAANLVTLFNEANYTNGCADVGLGIKVMLCGPSLFPQFMDQLLGRGGKLIYDGELPEMGKLGFQKPIIQYQDMYVVYDPVCPDKARTDPRTGSAYTKNACLGLNPDTFTFAFEPEAKFTVDKPFDLTQVDGGKDAFKSQMRTEMLGGCEAPAGNFYWEDVG